MTLASILLLAFALLGAVAPVPAPTDLDRLQGTWLTVSMVSNGKTLVGPGVPPQPGPATTLAYEGNRWLVRVGEKTVASGITRLDESATPKRIDLLNEPGVKNGQPQLGIYELDGDTYRYCLAPAGKPRPTEFSSPAGSGWSLGVSRRAPR